MGQKKCPECNSCMSHFWVMPNRYYYCGFCHTYYGGGKEVHLVPSPYADEPVQSGVQDPIRGDDG